MPVILQHQQRVLSAADQNIQIRRERGRAPGQGAGATVGMSADKRRAQCAQQSVSRYIHKGFTQEKIIRGFLAGEFSIRSVL
jgi:hypothetical protein